MPDLEVTQGAADTDSTNDVPGIQSLEGLSPSESADFGPFSEEETPVEEPQPQELGEEYKPYSQFPWDDIPEDTREAFLEKLKKFHGDMSRSSNDAAQLRRDVDLFKQKAEWFDTLAAQKWFQDAYIAQQGGGTPPAQSTTTQLKLSEYGLENEASDAIEKVIQERVGSALGPLNEQIQFLQRKMMADSTDRELAEVRKLAADQGLPSPDDKMSRITQLIQNGQARTVQDAWRLAIFDELPGLISKNARKEAQDELRQKASSTLPPRVGPVTEPGEQVFVGPNAVEEALRSAIADQVRSAASRR